jgi:protein gp37
MSLNPTRIGWTNFTWNPITGCYGPGGSHEHPRRCFYCYAQKVAEEKRPQLFPKEFDYHFHPERLKLTRKKPCKIFVGSMCDLLGDWVPTPDILKIMDVIKSKPDLTFQLLTKNPRRYLAKGLYPWPENCWLGASATNQDQWDAAVDVFRGNTFYNVKFISCEPLLHGIEPHEMYYIHQVIVGAQTGSNGQRVFSPPNHWVKKIHDATREHGTALFLKRNLGIPEVEQFREIPDLADPASVRY